MQDGPENYRIVFSRTVIVFYFLQRQTESVLGVSKLLPPLPPTCFPCICAPSERSSNALRPSMILILILSFMSHPFPLTNTNARIRTQTHFVLHLRPPSLALCIGLRLHHRPPHCSVSCTWTGHRGLVLYYTDRDKNTSWCMQGAQKKEQRQEGGRRREKKEGSKKRKM